MTPFTRHSGIAVPFLSDDVNTDAIIPTHRAINTARGALGGYAFEPLRYDHTGSLKPDFPPNQPRYAGASILVAGKNFGCGSSREMAVWAMWDMGFRVVLAESYGEIFYRNCCRNGLLPVMLARTEIEDLAKVLSEAEHPEVTVDLEGQTILSPSRSSITFDLGSALRTAFLNGLDEIQQTLLRRTEIEQFMRNDRERRPWIYFGAPNSQISIPQGRST